MMGEVSVEVAVLINSQISCNDTTYGTSCFIYSDFNSITAIPISDAGLLTELKIITDLIHYFTYKVSITSYG